MCQAELGLESSAQLIGELEPGFFGELSSNTIFRLVSKLGSNSSSNKN